MSEDIDSSRQRSDDGGQTIQDAELLRCYVADGSEEAFTQLVRRYLPLVYRAALRRTGGNATLAGDVSQYVFTELARNAVSLVRHVTLVGWLYTATRFAAAKAVRQERTRQRREQEVQAMHESSSPGPVLEWECLRLLIDETLDRLNETEREAILLRFFHDRPFAQIGATLRVSEDAARMRVERGLEKLRILLERRGVTSPGAALATVLASQTAVAVPAGLTSAVSAAALASAAAGGATMTLNLLNFMSTSKTTLGALGAIAILGIGAAIHETRAARRAEDRLRAAQASLASAIHRNDELKKALEESNRRLADFQSEIDRTRERLASTPQQAGVGPVVDSGRERIGSGTTMGIPNRVFSNMASRFLYLQYQERRALAEWQRFFEEARLSPEQQERIKKLGREEISGGLDLAADIFVQGLDENSPAVLKLRKELGDQSTARFAGEMRAILGDAVFQQWAQYQGQHRERRVSGELASRLYFNDAPLTTQQARQLEQLLVQNRFSPRAEGSATISVGGGSISRDDYGEYAQSRVQQSPGSLALIADPVIDQARAILAPSQLAVLQQLQAEQRWEIRLAANMAQRRSGQPGVAGSGTPKPPGG